MIAHADDLAERVLKAAQLAQPIFAAHDWRWGRRFEPETYKVPTVEQIADCIKDLYDTASTNEAGCCSTGRLTVYVDEDDGSIAVEVQLADLRDEVPDWDDHVAEARPEAAAKSLGGLC